MRISDWSSDVCSSDLQFRPYTVPELVELLAGAGLVAAAWIEPARYDPATYLADPGLRRRAAALPPDAQAALAERLSTTMSKHIVYAVPAARPRTEEHTSELQSLIRISYDVFCLKKKKQPPTT